MSTLQGYLFIVVAGAGLYLHYNKNQRPQVGRATRRAVEEKQNTQGRKDPKDKPKRQRGEAYNKDAADSDKPAKTQATKPAAAAPTKSHKKASSSSDDDGVDNREFARQLASIKQGTNLNAPKKNDEKRQKSVKQSRARAIEDKTENKSVVNKASAPSSTAGADADDDESSAASPDLKPQVAGDVSDMLEPGPSAPSVLRLTDTDKVKQKQAKKAKEPEKTKTKKQRQNEAKKLADKEAREEAEKQRKVLEEQQRRTARIAEGRAAKDGSAFMAQQQKAWTGNKANGSSSSSDAHEDYVNVPPLDTFDTSSHTGVTASKTPASANQKAETWMSSLPSEEEQLEMLREEEAWNTVKTKKSTKGKKKEPVAENIAESTGSIVADPVSATVQPAQKTQAVTNGTGQKPKSIYQQSPFAALSPNDDLVEEEWDV